jgi:hypothetical protein
MRKTPYEITSYDWRSKSLMIKIPDDQNLWWSRSLMT